MKLHIVPASTGVQWVKLGIKTFWQQPMALTALFFLSTAAVSLIAQIPVIGTYVALVLMPAVSLVMMLGAAEAHQGRMPRPALILAPFQSAPARIQALAILGVCYALGIFLISALTSLFDDGTLAKITQGHEAMTPELAEQIMQQSGFQIALCVGFVLYNLLVMLIWHAPALVHWHGVSPVKAIFFSVVACLRNFSAFFMYALGWLALAVVGSLALSLLTVLLSAVIGSSAVIAANILTIMLGLAVATMFLSSAVFTFRDCFSPPDPERKLQVDDVTYDYK